MISTFCILFEKKWSDACAWWGASRLNDGDRQPAVKTLVRITR